MIYQRKLQYRVIILIIGILLVVGTIGSVIMINLQRQSAVSLFEESALTLADALRDSLEHDMMGGNRLHIQDAVTLIARNDFINEVIVISNEREIYASGETSEVGDIVDDEIIIRTLESGKTLTRTEKKYGNDELCVIAPVLNKPDCYSCHDSEISVLGVIEIGVDREPLDNQLANQTLVMVLIGSFAFISVGVALTFVFRSEILNPLLKIAESTRRITRGDFTARTKIDRNDEIGGLAHTFNEMGETIERYAKALEDSKRQLEKRVQERTRQVQGLAADRGKLLGKLISAQEEERKRIARELHDEASQALTMIMMDLARARDTLPNDAKEAKEQLLHSRSIAEQALTDLRKLIYELRPEVLDQLGLVPALRSYVKNRLESENIEVRFSFDKLEDRLPTEVEVTLFRVIQEAVTNILRHSSASIVELQIVVKSSAVIASIRDNGQGFDVKSTLDNTESWGLRGIQERVAIARGTISISSTKGEGTFLQIKIPLGSM